MKQARFSTLVALAVIAQPFSPALGDEAAAKAMIVGHWNCTRAGLGSGVFTYRADGTGEQFAKGLRYDKGGVLLEMDANTSMNWTLETSGGQPTKIRQHDISIEIEIVRAEVNGVDVSQDAQFKEAIAAKFQNKPDRTGSFNVIEVTPQTLVLTTNKGRNDCYRLPDN